MPSDTTISNLIQSHLSSSSARISREVAKKRLAPSVSEDQFARVWNTMIDEGRLVTIGRSDTYALKAPTRAYQRQAIQEMQIGGP